ncbi:hypothetical protein NLX83_13130 [Allokutzneria sp. A3M-2-11 16]|uniref:hypothetical protein n=1 Tax=Allokutzneria sp. A3M-2-11 16 TaxID=2962043 RepID=UPI0020B7DFA2|nr:hypothetical protein [Allokutzneria sp. A3M-2-11 16]MCP3800202.1 hypothetical protein [Allokutzneria sp. A3M-2-11 16]
MPLPPMLVDGTEYHADPLRRVLSGLLADTPGVLGIGDFAVTVGSDYAATVSGGRAALPPPAAQHTGVYLTEATTSTTLPITPPHATRDRIDLLVAYAVPPATATDTGRWFLEIKTGTPEPEPKRPVVSGALLLREFRVFAESAARPVQSTDLRLSEGQQLISGAVLYGRSLPTPVPGRVWTDAGNGVTYAHSGNAWERLTERRTYAVALARPGGYTVTHQQEATWTQALRDPDGMWGGTTNPTRVRVPETGIYGYSASFAAERIGTGQAQMFRTAALLCKYSAEVGGSREAIAGQEGAGWAANPAGQWQFWGVSGAIEATRGQSLGIITDTATPEGVKIATNFLTRFLVWKIA